MGLKPKGWEYRTPLAKANGKKEKILPSLAVADYK